MRENIVYSVVVPVYNEEKCIDKFLSEVIPVLEDMAEPFEVIFVNDGSTDKSAEILRDHCERDGRIKLISLSRNFGQQAAILCGYENSCGKAVIEMDADLQDPPKILPLLAKKWREGYKVVHAKRKKRKGEGIFKRLTAGAYYRFLSRIAGYKIPVGSGDFKLIDREVIDIITSFKEHTPYLRGMTPFAGFKQAEVEFDREERSAGETKYTLKKMVKLATDGIVSCSDYPLRASLKCGTTLCIMSVITFLVFPLLLIWGIKVPLAAYIFPAIALAGGLIIFFNGLNGTYIYRIYDEVRGRPAYIVSEKKNFKEQ